MKRVLAGLFILSGISFLLFGFYLVYLRHSPKLLAFEGESMGRNESSTGQLPTKLTIPSLNISLPVVPSITDGKNWETTHNGISYLTNSPIPGEEGNSIFYGHNWASLLADLPQIKTGELIEVEMLDGKKRVFKVEYTAVVNPNQTYIIGDTNDTRLTLYTCTGFLDSKRFVVVAKPI